MPDYEQLLERIQILHDENDNSLFDFREIPEEEDIAKNMSDEEAEELIRGIKETKEEILEDRNKLDEMLGKFSDDLNDIPNFSLDNLE